MEASWDVGWQVIELCKLKARVHNAALEARSLSRIVDTEAFARAWDAANEKQREELWNYVVGIDKDNVDRWVKRVLSSVNLADKSIRELRDLARTAGVQYYNNLTKERLLEELTPE